jgi:hypothetical protein
VEGAFDRPYVVAPERTFEALAADLRALGWQRDDTAPFTPPLVPGEPELAGFRRGEASLVYTFNPVVRLRVLSPRGITTEDVLEIERGLPLATDADAARWVASEDERDILRGILAAPILGATELRPAIERRRAHPREAIRRAAEHALPQLERDHERPRLEALVLFRVIAERARPVLEELARDRKQVERLRPREEDYPRVFAAPALPRARRAYRDVWARVPEHDVPSRMTALDVDACTAGLFATALPARFPEGYRAIAGSLAPDRVWIVWRFREPSSNAGVRFDGLVAIDDRWIWLPKPYRALAS